MIKVIVVGHVGLSGEVRPEFIALAEQVHADAEATAENKTLSDESAESAANSAIASGNSAATSTAQAVISIAQAVISTEQATAAEGFKNTAGTYKDDALTAKTAAETARDVTEGYKNTAGTYKDDALTAKTAAETARDASYATNKIYATTGAGIAATTNGQYFWTPSVGLDYVVLYANTSGVAVEQLRIAAKSVFDIINQLLLSTMSVTQNAKSEKLYRDTAVVPWGVFDKNGRSPLSITTDSAALIRVMGALIEPAITRKRDRDDYPFAITDNKNGLARLALAVLQNGSVLIPELLLSTNTGTARTRGNKYKSAITDLANHILLGFADDGTVDMLLSSTTLQQVQTYLYQPPAKLLTYSGFNVRTVKSGVIVATRQEADKTVFDVRQRQLTNSLTTAIVEHANPIEMINFYGQSNAGQGGLGGTLLSATPKFPHHAMQFNAGRDMHGTTVVNASTLSDIVPTYDPVTAINAAGHFPATLTAYALEQFNRDQGRAGAGYLMRTTWYGGQPLDSFIRGTTPWNNLMTACAQAPIVAAKYDRTAICKWLMWVQGEGGALLSGAASWDQANYVSSLTTMIADIRTEIKTQTGQAALPEFALVQVNDFDTTNVVRGVYLAQLDVAKALVGAGVTLCGPMYQCPFADDFTYTGGDNIHNSPIGRMILSEMIALAYETKIINGTTFKPLWPTSATLTGSYIDIVFDVPANGLAFDTTWILPATNYGFVYSDSTSSATISSVSILNSTTVRVQLSAVPSGTSKKIKYATTAQENTRDLWSLSRGQLISPTGRASVFYRMGYAVPPTINHYAVRFELGV